MKFTPEVVAALAVLRNAAENDFERHRLDVLERDLTSPPVVEVIDDFHQQFDNFIFPKIKSGHYSSHSFPVHRYVWTYYNGKIPEGYEIHHLDNDPSNNDIKNLIALTGNEHKRLHWKQPETKQYTCQCCGKIFKSTSKQPAKFCSIRCSSTDKRKKNGRKYTVVRNCVICGKEFSTSKYSKAKTCSTACSSKLSGQTQREMNQLKKEEELYSIQTSSADKNSRS